jgi:YHS domain-containing protein
MSRNVRHTVLAAAFLLFTSIVPAFAGEFFEKDGVAIRGYDPIAYFEEMKPVKGLAEFHAEYQGSTSYFSTVTNRDRFTMQPDKFAPQYGGYLTLPRFYRHLHKGENDEIGGAHASNSATSVYRGI